VLGVLAMNGRDLDRSQALHEESLEIIERLEGDDGLGAAVCLQNLGLVAFLRTDADDDARVYFERALEIWRERLGPEHPQSAEAWIMLGNMAHRGKRLDDAEAHYQRALELLERAHGPDHIRIAQPLNGLALVAEDRGDLDRAIVVLERAIAVSQANNGEDDLGVATFESNLGDVLAKKGSHEQALEKYRHSLAIFTRVLGPEHRGTSDGHSAIGHELLELGRPAEAVEPLERALALRIALDAPPRYRWRPRFDLARALVGSGGDRQRARELARTAREEVLQTDDHEPLAAIDALLSELR
jgi:tetratricopeptide (TPR) repeat protein